MKLEDFQANAAVRGILSDGLVTVVSVQWFGSEALELTYKTPTGKVANELLYRHDEPRIEIVEVGRPWSFDGDGALFRLVSEAQRIRLAHLFDPLLAVHTSVVEPLPHQITAVYESMLPRQPLRFLLADDPGAGKTIMAGLLSSLTRHFLLMTATPHNGKEEDFQLFMALIDGDRFEGRFRDGVHAADVSDLMRRMVKEKLLKCDGAPLFPERIAHTVPYKLSDAEAHLYKVVTDYVREEFNRAEALENDQRAGTVGFALTILQRRLASSPEAIHQSLRCRRERLESRLRELEVLQRGGQAPLALTAAGPGLDAEDVEDLDEAPEDEVEAAAEDILDRATAARSIVELKAEIETLKNLEGLALEVRQSGADTKWRELASLLGEIFTAAGLAGQIAETAVPYGGNPIPRPTASPKQKLVIFTEHRDTLRYLHGRITTLLGSEESVVLIHGSMGREDRLKAQEAFRHDPQVQVLLAVRLQDLLEERALVHDAMDASLTRSGDRRIISKRMLYVELDEDGVTRHMHYAPYLDYRPLAEDDPGPETILERPQCAWIDRDMEKKAQGYAVANVVPEHLAEVRDAKLALIAKTEAAVKDRLTKEITYWDHRAEQLKLQERAGKTGARLNSGEARKRADTLQARLQKRLAELRLEAQISPLPPVVLGGLLVIPQGLIDKMSGREPVGTRTATDTQESAARARKIIMEVERNLGFDPTDREFEKLGYDIESRMPGTGRLRFIEVKGRVSGAATITVTRNEILYSLNKPEDFILGIVEFIDGTDHRVHYVRQPFQREPDFGVTSVNYDFAELLARAGTPS